jgi:predicted SnoaL-like aldol condensation-catalyzing enzyme
MFAGGVVPNRRQVLPHIPGYIPVYIQHGDVPPEDQNEFAEFFQLAAKNVPQKFSHTIHNRMTTVKVTEQSDSTVGVSETTTNYSVNSKSPASTSSVVNMVSNRVPVK